MRISAIQMHRSVFKHRRVYEPLDDDSQSYIKLINLQSKIIANRVPAQLHAHALVSLLPVLLVFSQKMTTEGRMQLYSEHRLTSFALDSG